MKTIFALLALVAAAVAIAEPQPNAPASKPAAASQFTNQGKVLDVMDASIYTYIQVSSDKTSVWLAASKTTVAKGDTIRYPSGAAMTNFYSKSLNRTFDTIIFLDKIEIVKK